MHKILISLGGSLKHSSHGMTSRLEGLGAEGLAKSASAIGITHLDVGRRHGNDEGCGKEQGHYKRTL